jgi:hypothetical protein
MMAKGLMAKSDNAGTKKSPLQIQMLERFYSGKYIYATSSGSVPAEYVIYSFFCSVLCCG